MSWTRGRTVGRGSFAAVSVAAALGSGEVFAVKSARVSGSGALRREQAILSALDCPHVVAYRGWDVTREEGERVYNLFMEYAPRGTLADAARERGGRLKEAEVRSRAREVLRGLEYVHRRGIAHCDIKGQNILVTSEGAKIADFGLAIRVDDGVAGPVGGTPLFMAPEVARGGRPGFAADVWSLGCTVLEIATGRPPWTDVADPISAIHRIGFSAESPEVPGFLSEQCRDFLSQCLRRDPSERWSASELLAHVFLEDEAPDFLSEEIELKIPNTRSPTSVLEQAIWSSTEHSEPCQALLRRSSLNRPPSERIRQLIGEWGANSISPPQMPNWEWDESWVAVRSSESSEEAPETSRRANAEEEEEEEEEDDDVVVVVSCRHGDLQNSSDWEREEDDDSTLRGCNLLGSCEITKFVKIELEIADFPSSCLFLPKSHLGNRLHLPSLHLICLLFFWVLFIIIVIYKNVKLFRGPKKKINKFNTTFQTYQINVQRLIGMTKSSTKLVLHLYQQTCLERIM